MSNERNRKILEDVLEGKAFVDVAMELGIHPVTVRTAFLREVRKLAPDLWEEGRAAGYHGTYRTPSVDWLRENKGRIFVAPALRAKNTLDAGIAAAIVLLETCGYTVTPNARNNRLPEGSPVD